MTDPARGVGLEHLLRGERPHAATACALHLSWLRSSTRVGLALTAQYPDQDAWEAFLGDPEVQQEIAAFAVVVDDIRHQIQVGDALDLAALEQAGAQHYQRALESLWLTAERLQVDPEDLLVVLTYA